MKPKILTFILTAITGFAFICCEKDDADIPGTVDLFLLESYQKGVGSQIDETTVVTNEEPLVRYEDFISYNPEQYVFLITDRAKAAIQGLQHSSFGIAFAIKANNELIYTGYFWPSFSSGGCNWVVIDPLATGLTNTLTVELGYPGLLEGVEIPDKRNDKRILDIFKRDHKLED
ncbi:MAG: hypothetical protein RBS73_14120 [Prolixibacteraceae bacterium]|jgi:hypothetical protein|nr:hypothetical protein [Prolixibacteraceae bacterium]